MQWKFVVTFEYSFILHFHKLFADFPENEREVHTGKNKIWWLLLLDNKTLCYHHSWKKGEHARESFLKKVRGESSCKAL